MAVQRIKRIIDLNSVTSPDMDSVIHVTLPDTEADRDRIETLTDLKGTLGVNDLAGTGRTTETVKGNADAIAALQLVVAVIPGKMELYTGSVLPTGYIWARGETIGNATSGATYAGAEYEDLFDLYNVNGLYGNDGTGVFADGDTVLAPDLRNIVPYGANASTRSINGVTNPATPLGTTHNDKTQYHWHRNYDTTAGGTEENSTPYADKGNTATGTSGYATREMITDTINAGGTPRGGLTTMAAGIGINYIIKY